MIFRKQINRWRLSKSLSVLQVAYEMPLKFPLDALDNTTLQMVTGAAYDTGGNEFDAAAAFMTLRIKSEFEAEIALGKRPGLIDARSERIKLYIGIQRTKHKMKFLNLHLDTMRQIMRLREVADKENGTPQV